MTKKTLSKILEGYLDDYMTQDSQKFIQMHTVAQHKGVEKMGTTDDKLFKASNIKQTKLGGSKKEHGYKSPEDEKAYDPNAEGQKKPVKEEKKHSKDCECEKCEDDREEIKEESLSEKTLTPAELKKREQIAQAMERQHPGMDKSKKMAIATAAAKRVAESEEISEAGMPASVIKHKQDLANMSDKAFAEKHGSKSEKELRDMAARHGYGFNKATKTGSDHYVKRVAAGLKEDVEGLDEISSRAKSAYLGTAVADLTARSQEHGYNVAKKKKDLGDNPRKIMNRQDGIYRATKGMRKEAVDHDDDGWYTHREIHGDKGISKEDWKKGIRMNSKGERVQTRKEEIEIDEAKRGRPSLKNPEQNIEPIQTQLQKRHKQHEVDVTFADKSSHAIPREHANKALKHLSSLKPIHRDEAQKQMSSSKQGFYDTLAGKKPEAKPKITLAKLTSMKKSSSVSDEAREKKKGGGDD